MSRFKQEPQRNGHACNIGRALRGYGTRVMNMPHFIFIPLSGSRVPSAQDRHLSVRSHDLLGVSPWIARSPSTGFDLSDELGHQTVEQGGFLQIKGVARLREHGEAGARHGP